MALYEDRETGFIFSTWTSENGCEIISSKLDRDNNYAVSECLSAWGFASYKVAYKALDAARRMLANGAKKDDVVEYLDDRRCGLSNAQIIARRKALREIEEFRGLQKETVEVYEDCEEPFGFQYFEAISFTLKDEMFAFYENYLAGRGDTPEEALSALNAKRLGLGLNRVEMPVIEYIGFTDVVQTAYDLLVRWHGERMFIDNTEVESYKEQEWIDSNINPDDIVILEDGWKQAPVHIEWFVI